MDADGDRHSSSSGEASNADSGRGPSEEGDHNILPAHTAGNQPFLANTAVFKIRCLGIVKLNIFHLDI